MTTTASLDRRFFIRGDHVLVRSQTPASVGAGVQIQHHRGLGFEVGITHEDPRPVLPRFEGIVGEPPAHGRHRHLTPSASNCRASSAVLQRESGTSRSTGSEHAHTVTRARSAGVYTGGRPDRGASPRPLRPFAANRARHLRTVSTQPPSSAAIAAFEAPSAASTTINARALSRRPHCVETTPDELLTTTTKSAIIL